MIKLVPPLWFITCFISKTTIYKVLLPEATVHWYFQDLLVWRLRDSLLQAFYKKVVLRNIVKFKINHLYQSLLNKVCKINQKMVLEEVISCEFFRKKNRATVQRNTSGFANSFLRNISVWLLQLLALGKSRHC